MLAPLAPTPLSDSFLAAGMSPFWEALPWCVAFVTAGWAIWRGRRERLLAKKLRKSEALLGNILEAAPGELWVTDASGRFSRANAAAVRRWGNAPGKGVEDLPEESATLLQECHRTAFEGRTARVEMEISKANPLERYDLVVSPLLDEGSIVGVVGMGFDISEKTALSEAKQKSERLLRSLVENSAEAVALVGAEGEIIYANPSSTRILGYPFPKFTGYNAFQLIHSEDRAFVANQARQSMKRPGDGVPVQARVHHHNGSWRLVEGTLTNLLGDPKIAGILFNFRDITERTRAQAALRESETRFQAFIDHSPALIYMKDPHGRYLQVNRRFEKIVGMPRAAIIGRRDEDLFSEDLAREFRNNDRRTIDADRALEFEEILEQKDGPHTLLAQKFPLHDTGGQIAALCGISTDITDRLQLEQQLRQVQRMESIGQLAGGIAHDFNNLLTVIQGHASLMEEEGMSSSVAECLAQITAASDQASNLTRQLLAFSRRQTIHPQDEDLSEIVSAGAKMWRGVLGDHIEFQGQLAPSLPAIHADRQMIEQVISNLVINARDAMPNGGKLTIATEARSPELNNYPVESGVPMGSCVCLSVSDTGSGIDPIDLPRIFEPFFTTKTAGKGSGLGLATVYGIVRQHHGWIDVQSERGQGARFDVFLPVALETASPEPGDTSGHRGNETVLLVEDDETLRRIICAILERHGYRVLEAGSGIAALKIWEDKRDLIDLVFTDIVMPEALDGCALANRLRSEKPGAKILFTSGYSGHSFDAKIALVEGVNFLPKPFHPLKLLGMVRAALDVG